MAYQYRDFWIRDWEPRDRHPAAQLIAQVLAEFRLCCDPDGVDRDVLDVERAYWQTGGAFWVAEQAGMVVGTIGFYPISRGHKAVELRKMYLHPSVRGQGLGRYLLQTLEAEIRQRGFAQIWLETATVLAGAVALYEASGYQQRDPSEIETARCDRLYQKSLS